MQNACTEEHCGKKEDISKWRDISWIGRISIAKMPVLSKLICRFSAIPIRILDFKNINWHFDSKIYIDMQRTLIVKTILKKDKFGEFSLSIKEIL